MSANTIRLIFLTAAIFNIVIGLLLFFSAALLFELFRVTPAPVETLFLYLFSWLVITFGLAYYWVSKDPARHTALIRLGIVGKLGVVAIGLIEVSLGAVSWQFLLLVSVDLVYAMLFWRALKNL